MKGCDRCHVDRRWNFYISTILLVMLISFIGVFYSENGTPKILIFEESESRLGFHNHALKISVIEHSKHDDLDSNFRTFQHELGHYIYADYMTEDERREWHSLHYASRDFVSTYAMINPSEDFSESFENTILVKYDSEYLNYVNKDKALFMDRVWVRIHEDELNNAPYINFTDVI